MSDTCPTCGSDDHELIGDSLTRCRDEWHDEQPTTYGHDEAMRDLDGCDYGVLPPEQPTTPEDVEAAIERTFERSLGHAAYFHPHDYRQQVIAEIEADHNTLRAHIEALTAERNQPSTTPEDVEAALDKLREACGIDSSTPSAWAINNHRYLATLRAYVEAVEVERGGTQCPACGEAAYPLTVAEACVDFAKPYRTRAEAAESERDTLRERVAKLEAVRAAAKSVIQRGHLYGVGDLAHFVISTRPMFDLDAALDAAEES